MGAKKTRVLIAGSGPAGLTAAIYCARAGLQPVVLEGMEPGGQLTTTNEVENFPGFPEGVLGGELMDRMRKQAERFGAQLVMDLLAQVSGDAPPYLVKTAGGEEYLTEALIIATGASAKYLGLESEERYKGRGVSACATCDGFFFRDKVVAVIGGGDTAAEEALFLTRFATKVYLIHRRDALRAAKVLRDRLAANEKIELVLDSVVDEVLGDGEKLTGLTIRNVKSGDKHELKVDGMFVAIGREPNTAPFKGWLELDPQGYVVTDPRTLRTSREGVWAAGDVQDPIYQQAVTAAGSGCMAALEVEKWLEANPKPPWR